MKRGNSRPGWPETLDRGLPADLDEGHPTDVVASPYSSLPCTIPDSNPTWCQKRICIGLEGGMPLCTHKALTLASIKEMYSVGANEKGETPSDSAGPFYQMTCTHESHKYHGETSDSANALFRAVRIRRGPGEAHFRWTETTLAASPFAPTSATIKESS
ncbi:hypothetical protein VTI74DRAFT_8931 [Chaetomium olivicolor]